MLLLAGRVSLSTPAGSFVAPRRRQRHLSHRLAQSTAQGHNRLLAYPLLTNPFPSAGSLTSLPFHSGTSATLQIPTLHSSFVPFTSLENTRQAKRLRSFVTAPLPLPLATAHLVYPIIVYLTTIL